MSAPATPARNASPEDLDFVAFYDRHLPVVYGYLLRLCGGDRHHAEDLTQDTWIQLVDRLAAGHRECADIRWLISVARSRFVDGWRQEQRSNRRLRLAWASDDRDDEKPPERGDLVAYLADLDTDQRLVLTLKYVDGLSVADVAAQVGRSIDATYSLLARARRELRTHAEAERK